MNRTDEIEAFCDRLKDEWKRVPDMRFGQLLCNALGEVALDESISIYHVGNDRLMELIMSYVYRKNRKSHI